MKFQRLLIVFLFSLSSAQFNIQNYLNCSINVDSKNQVLCESKVCILDTDLIFTAATQDSSVLPCSDFPEFAIGSFKKYRALNDRYQYKGMQSDVEEIHREKSRKVLSEKVKENEPHLFKVFKRYFSMCVNSSKFFTKMNEVSRKIKIYLITTYIALIEIEGRIAFTNYLKNLG